MEVYFHDDRNDMSAVSYEVTHLSRILAKNGHKVGIMTPTDLKEGAYDDLYKGRIYKAKPTDEFDRIILFSGSFPLCKHGSATIIPELRNQTKRLDFLLTDLRLEPDRQYYKHFDNIYTQSTKKGGLDFLNELGYKNAYGGVSEFLPFEHKWKHDNVEDVLKDKDVHYYFGGTERDRLKEYLEYVWRPDCTYTGRSPTLGFNNRVTRDVFMDYLDRAKHSVCFADESYNKNHFVLPRFYENIMHDIICFCSNTFDPDEHMIGKYDWRRVTNYMELREKMKELDDDEDNYLALLRRQRKELKPEYINGDYVYEMITKPVGEE